MCGSCNDPFHDLDDDLSDLFGAPSDLDKASAFARDVLAPSKVTSTRTYEEKCIDCRGTGIWRSRSGYSSGQCFKCKGTGVCCICGRELTNHASIDAGIGPICADKYGW